MLEKIPKAEVEVAPESAKSVYLASPWFNDAQMKRMQDTLAVLKDWASRSTHRKIYAPYEELVCPPDASPELRWKTYAMNVNECSYCDIIVAVTDEKDMGTLFELGYACAVRDFNIRQDNDWYFVRPVTVGLALNIPEGAPFNLMLAEGLDVVCRSLNQLQDYLLKGVIPENTGSIE